MTIQFLRDTIAMSEQHLKLRLNDIVQEADRTNQSRANDALRYVREMSRCFELLERELVRNAEKAGYNRRDMEDDVEDFSIKCSLTVTSENL